MPNGMLPAGQHVSFAQIVRQQAALATRPPFFYPFAFPANAWFAWRTGLPSIATTCSPRKHYAGHRPCHRCGRDDISRQRLGSRVPRISGAICDGWRARVRSSPCRLDIPGDMPVTVEVHARTRLLDPRFR